MYRIDDDRHTNALLAALDRDVPVRLITEPLQYRDARRYKHAYNVDRLFKAGVQVRFRGHAGLTHEKLTLLHEQQMAVIGSSNWTMSSANSQLEHNYFTRKPDLYQWATEHFERKWNNLGPTPETTPFVPRAPDAPSRPSPADQAEGRPLSVTLRWFGGAWAWYYDIYVGTSPNDLRLVRSNAALGPNPTETTALKSFAVGGLEPATTYYWKIVGRTAADRTKSSRIWSFRTRS